MRWAVSAGPMRAIAAIAAVAAAGGTARADEAVSETGVRIAIEAPAGCPTASEVAAKLDAAVDGELAQSAVAITITGRARYELRLIIDERAEQARFLSARRCSEVVDAAVLVLSLALLPPEPEPEPAPKPPEPPTVAAAEASSADTSDADTSDDRPPGSEEAPPIDIERPAAPRPPPSLPIALSLGAAAAVDGGTLPKVAGGVGVVLHARRGDLSLGGSATYFPTHRAEVDPEMGAGADINATAISARGCRLTGPMWLCVGGELSVLAATGVGVESAERDRFFLFGFTSAARYRLVFGERLAMAATAELVGHPARPAYFLENPRRLVHRPGWLSGRFWLVGEVVIY